MECLEIQKHLKPQSYVAFNEKKKNPPKLMLLVSWVFSIVTIVSLSRKQPNN